MNVPQIRLDSTFAKININTNNASLDIEQPKASLSIEQPKAELSIKTTPSKLTIDQTQAWEDMDLKHISKRIEEFAQDGYNGWLEGIARRAQQGDELMMIENSGNPIVAQAKVNSERPEKKFNIGWIPSPFSVKTNYQPSEVEINWKENKPIIEAESNKPIMQYNPGNVDISMDRYASVKIDFTNLKYVGINYEQEI